MHVHICTYIRISINTCTTNAHKHTPCTETNLVKVDVQPFTALSNFPSHLNVLESPTNPTSWWIRRHMLMAWR